MADTGRAGLRSAPRGTTAPPPERSTHAPSPAGPRSAPRPIPPTTTSSPRPNPPSGRRRWASAGSRTVALPVTPPTADPAQAADPGAPATPATPGAAVGPPSGGAPTTGRAPTLGGGFRAVAPPTGHTPADHAPGGAPTTGRAPTASPAGGFRTVAPPTGRTDVDNPGPGAPATGGMPTESPAGGFPAAAGGQAPATAPSTGPTPAAPDGVDGPTASTRTLLSPRMRSAHRSGVGWWHPPKARPRVDGARHRAAEGERSGRTTRRRRIRLVLLGLAASAFLGPVLAFAVGYVRLPRPHAGRRGEQPGRAALLRQRRPAHPPRPRAGQPHEGADPGRAGARARGRARRRGPQLLLEPRLRPDRHRARRVEPVRGGDGGGSTITQQYVKNTLVGDEPSLWRKYKELIVSVKVSQENTKDQILGDYLNAHLLRPRRLRHPGGEPGLLRQERAGPHGRRGRRARRRDPVAVALGPGREPRPRRGALELRPRRHGRPGLAHPARARGANASRPPSPAPRNAAACPRAPTGTSSRRCIAELADLGITEQDVAAARACASPRRSTRPGSARPSTPCGRDRRASPTNLRSATVSIDPQTGGILAYYGGDNGVGPGLRARREAGGLHVQALRRARRAAAGPADRISAPSSRASRCPATCATSTAPTARTASLKQAMTLSNNVVFNSPRRTRSAAQAVAAAARPAGHQPAAERPERAASRWATRRSTAVDLASAYATIAAGACATAAPRACVVTTAGRGPLHQSATAGERRFDRLASRATSPRRCSTSPRTTTSACTAGAGGGEDRHGPVARRGPEQRRVDGGVHPVRRRRPCGWAPTATSRSARRPAARSPGKDLPGDAWHDVHGRRHRGPSHGRVRPVPGRSARRLRTCRPTSIRASRRPPRPRPLAQRGRDAGPSEQPAPTRHPDGTARRRTLGLHVVGALRLVS